MSHALNGRRGNATLEFALVFGLMWALLAGGFRFGYSIFVYHSLLNAIAGAARYAARVDFDEPDHTFASSVRNMAVYGSPAGSGTALVPGLSTGAVSVTWTVDSKGLPLTITVGVNSFTVSRVLESVTWTNKPQVTVRYAGSFKS